MKDPLQACGHQEHVRFFNALPSCVLGKCLFGPGFQWHTFVLTRACRREVVVEKRHTFSCTHVCSANQRKLEFHTEEWAGLHIAALAAVCFVSCVRSVGHSIFAFCHWETDFW